MQAATRWRRRVRVRALERAVHPSQALGLFGPERRPVLLDSAGGAPARWSWLAFDPLESWTLAPPVGARFEELLRERLRALELELEGEPPGPFAGGLLAALAYDLGVSGEALDLPREPWGQPLLVGGLYTDFLVRDEASGASWLVLGEDAAADARAREASERRARELERALCGPAPAAAQGRPAVGTLGPLQRHTSVHEHARRVHAARAWIEAGEIYQANLAHRFTRAVRGTPAELYARLRTANRAPYMGALLWEGGALLSASPELLLESDGHEARTRPIKGTIARGRDPHADAEQARALLASAKDRAELAMIVDLERNDLGRVARAGGVSVHGFPSLESYASVHHLAADVRAQLRPEVDGCALLAALFPGGSISGAPKLRAMEAIAALEGEGRGFFCGALGWLDARGGALFNVLIRTLLWRPRPELGERAGEISFRVGGGITWSSRAPDEEAETLAKAASLALD